MFFVAKVFLAGLIIAFSSWLAGQYPKLAGFIIALPIASLIAIIFTILMCYLLTNLFLEKNHKKT